MGSAAARLKEFRGATICQEDTMSVNEQVEGIVWAQEDRQGWPPRLKLILAFVIGFLALSPAILGIHWERILPW